MPDKPLPCMMRFGEELGQLRVQTSLGGRLCDLAIIYPSSPEAFHYRAEDLARFSERHIPIRELLEAAKDSLDQLKIYRKEVHFHRDLGNAVPERLEQAIAKAAAKG